MDREEEYESEIAIYEKRLKEIEVWKSKMENMKWNVEYIWKKIGGDNESVDNKYITANKQLQQYYDKTKLYYQQKILQLQRSHPATGKGTSNDNGDELKNKEVTKKSSKRYSTKRLHQKIKYSTYLDTYF